MIIGPAQFRKFEAEMAEAKRLAESMTDEEAVERLVKEKPELADMYREHLEASLKTEKKALNPWAWRVMWKWRKIALDSENCGWSTQTLLDKFSEILLVPTVKKNMTIHNR